MKIPEKGEMKMSGCENCSGCSGCASGGGCSGCGGTLTLTAGERDFLMELAQIPFLPVARKASEETPVYLEAGRKTGKLLPPCF